MKSTLTKETVRKMEEEALKKVENDPWRLHFHLMPPSGWLNDPNGLSEVDGTNHIFFQYTPQDIKSTTTNCWGHYTTKDFVNYTYELPPLYPENDYEINGVYSGSGITGPEGLKAYYTGNVKHPGDHDYIHTGREQNLILAEDYDKDEGIFKQKTVLMRNEDYPENMTLHVRDPKVIKRDGKFYMLLGGRTKEDIGSAILYESEDGRDWKLKEVIEGNDELGYMWECPDGITVEDQDFLLISPQGIEAQGNKYNNVYQAGYLPLFHKNGKTTFGEFEELDHGFDFYAPQTYTDEEGRTILIGWQGIPDADYEYPTIENGWIHALTIPRVISQESGKLIQTPVEELKTLRVSKKEYQLDGGDATIETPKVYEIELKDPSKEGEFIINNACIFKWNQNEAELTFESDRDSVRSAGAGRTTRKTEIQGMHHLQIFVDTSSIEVFINHGEQVFTTRYFGTERPSLESKGVTGKLTIYELDSFTVKRPDGTTVFDLK